jgi:D-hydroxyproline dehydrogenase subunit alpha
MNKIETEVLIVGGGAAGMSAAVAAAESGAGITIVDDNPRLGGQIWRAELGRTKSETAAGLIDALEEGSIRIINNAQVFAAPAENLLAAETTGGRIELEFQKLILATGARELFLPFPGWALPNVLGAGGLQALVKGGLNITNKRVVVAGTGPLLLAVAEYLKAKGAAVAAIVEQAPAARINRFARGLRRSPAKLLQAAVLRAKLIGVPYLKDAWVVAAQGDAKLRSVAVRDSRMRVIDCDYLACGFHLVPNLELAALLGCEITHGYVAVDEFQQTSKREIFCAGEPTGIGGVEASLVEGTIAGYTAAGNQKRARESFSKREKTRRFADALNRTFALRDELRTLADDATVVCRCEDVQYGKLKEFDNWRTAKLQTRCGMGPCQGRVCGAAVEFLYGWKPDSIRPPIFPVKLENL